VWFTELRGGVPVPPGESPAGTGKLPALPPAPAGVDPFLVWFGNCAAVSPFRQELEQHKRWNNRSAARWAGCCPLCVLGRLAGQASCLCYPTRVQNKEPDLHPTLSGDEV